MAIESMITGIQHIGIPCADLDETIRFYEGLGFQLTWRAAPGSAGNVAFLQKGPCVIVGRNADYILKDRPDVLKVFVHADMAFRAKRIVEEYGERTETPEQRLKDKDKRRSTYYRFYTGQKWGQVQSYDMTLNSGKLGIEKCAELICTILT